MCGVEGEALSAKAVGTHAIVRRMLIGSPKWRSAAAAASAAVAARLETQLHTKESAILLPLALLFSSSRCVPAVFLSVSPRFDNAVEMYCPVSVGACRLRRMSC